MRIDLALNESHVAFYVSREAAQTIARIYFDLASDYPVPAALQAAAFECAAENWLKQIEEIGSIKLQIRGLTENASLADTRPLVSFGIAAPGQPLQTAHLAGVDGPLDLPAFLPKPPQRDVDDLALRFPLDVGHSDLSLTDLRALAPGDILLVRSPELIAQSMASISLTRGTGITVAIDGSRLTIIKYGRTMATDPNDGNMAPTDTKSDGAIASADDHAGGQSGGPATDPLLQPETIEDIPLRLAFDLGEIELTIGELRRLVEGQSFDLATLPERAVRVRLNGRQIGTGEIVEIGNRIGVRINELMG